MKCLFAVSMLVIGIVLAIYDVTISDWGCWIIIICSALNNLIGHLDEVSENE